MATCKRHCGCPVTLKAETHDNKQKNLSSSILQVLISNVFIEIPMQDIILQSSRDKGSKNALASISQSETSSSKPTFRFVGRGINTQLILTRNADMEFQSFKSSERKKRLPFEWPRYACSIEPEVCL